MIMLSTTYPVGTTTVTWTVKDIHGNIITATQDVVVTDNEAPSITAAADCCSEQYNRCMFSSGNTYSTNNR
jgi:hypothetical protein